MGAQVYFGLLAILLLLSPVLFLLYAILTDNPYRGGRSALPSDYRPEANRPRPGTQPGRCAACGTDNDAEYDYCRACGSELETPDYDPDSPSEWPSRSE